MKPTSLKIATALSLAIGACGVIANAAVDSRESEQIADQVQQAQDRSKVSSDKYIQGQLNELRDRYGFTVTCHYKFASNLDNSQCQAGIDRLKQALENVPVYVAREDLHSYTIRLDTPERGAKGAIVDENEVSIPYTWNSGAMQNYLNDQMKVSFATDIDKIDRLNARMENEIHDKYLLKVERDPSLSKIEYYEGLQKFMLAPQYAYGQQGPSDTVFNRFGYDTVVLSTKDSGIYEDKGELRIKVDAKKTPSQFGGQLISQVADEGAWRGYDRNDVSHFRAQVSEKNRLMAEVQSTLKRGQGAQSFASNNVSVQCALDQSKPNSITVKECVEGLNKLKATIDKKGTPNLLAAQTILIADKSVTDPQYVKGNNVMVLEYNDIPERDLYKGTPANSQAPAKGQPYVR